MSTISDSSSISEEWTSRLAILILAAVTSISLSGCRADNCKAAINAESQYRSAILSGTDNIPSAQTTISPCIEATPSASLIIESPAPETDILQDYEETEPQPVEPAEQSVAEPTDEELVKVIDYIPTIYVDLKYATEDNFTGKVLYDFSDAYLRYGTVKKLAVIQTYLFEKGYSLLIWDAYRPVSAQFTLWETCPNPTYVANPNNGYSSHSKGNTVDVTLVKDDGTAIPMPTGFDDFSAFADRDYSDVSDEAAANATLLENTMFAHGFIGYNGEWWHFSDSAAYSVIES
jgi:zinc D-Ala-D-Ala dipeptidase